MKVISRETDDKNKLRIQRIDNSVFHQAIGLCWDQKRTTALLATGTPQEREDYLLGVRFLSCGVIAVMALLCYLAWP